MSKNLKISQQLRKAILESEKSRYRIAKETGISQASLSKFVNGSRGLSMEKIDILGELLDLQLVPQKKGK